LVRAGVVVPDRATSGRSAHAGWDQSADAPAAKPAAGSKAGARRVEGRTAAAGGARAERAAPVLRLVAGHRPCPPRTPFVVLVLAVLGGGLVGLLLLNSAAAADSFAQERLQQQNADLTVREQELSREVAAMEAPGALARQARKLGLVPSGEPGFLIVGPDGSTREVGTPSPAAAPAPPPSSPTAGPGTPTSTAGRTAQPTTTATTTATTPPTTAARAGATPNPANGPAPTPTTQPAPAPGPRR
jgi:cell division protein FtsB